MSKFQREMEGPSKRSAITSAAVRIGFACFDLGAGNDLHVTIGRRYGATDEELVEMQRFVDDRIKPCEPFVVTFGNFCQMGERGTFPAYRVYFEDRVVLEFYRRFYKEAPGKALYPKPKFHVTVDTPQKREILENMMRSCGYRMLLSNATFKTRVEGGDPEVTESTWQCQVCRNVNPVSQKQCLSQGCDQWRPIGLSAATPVRPGDWTCCGVNNYASRSLCMVCNKPKLASIGSDQSPYDLPPPPSSASAPVLQQLQAAKYRIGDWRCPRCNFKIFASKDQCIKCGTKRE